MLYSPLGCHILTKTNYLVDIYNPAEVCDNGAPCLLRQTHAFSLQQAAKRPSPVPAVEECTPIPCLFLSPPACPVEPSPWEYPGLTSWKEPSFLCCFWANFNDSSCIHAHLWLAFLNFFSSNVLICQAVSSLLNNLQCLENRWTLPPGSMQKWNFIHQTSVCDILFGMAVSTATLSPSSSIVFPSAQSFLDTTSRQTQHWAASSLHCGSTSHRIILDCSCTNTYLEKVCVLENLQCRQRKWFSKHSSISGNGYPGSQAHCRADYTDGLPFSRTGANCYSTYKFCFNPEKTFWRNYIMPFHVPFHEKLRKKTRRNALYSAAQLVQTSFPEGWLV